MEMIAKVGCLVLLCMVVVAPHADAITCGQISSGLAPCFTYLTKGGAVPANCCSGVKSINSAAQTTPDRQTACKCLKSLAAGMSAIIPANAAGLPGKCGVSIPYQISPSVDCSKIK